jgi:uncharacterized protein YdeI (YjbR/CyaY-like superfamily)
VSDQVEAYIERSDPWAAEIIALRAVLLAAGLDEAIKWGKPCYAHDGNNIAIVQEMSDFLALMFFKGALLTDPTGVLEDQGPNSRSAKRMVFTSVADVERLADTVRECVAEAIDVEAQGLSVGPAPEPVFVAELQDRLDNDAAFRAGFERLTPGRRREYNLYFSGAKQTKTRAARVDKYADKIRDGKGFRDR